MDGAGEGRIFFHIVLPVLRPILVTLAVFVFLTAWNDFMWPLIVLSDQRKYTLPVALANLSGEHVQDTELMMAGSVLTLLPVVILFLAAAALLHARADARQRQGLSMAHGRRGASALTRALGRARGRAGGRDRRAGASHAGATRALAAAAGPAAVAR